MEIIHSSYVFLVLTNEVTTGFNVNSITAFQPYETITAGIYAFRRKIIENLTPP